MIQFNLLPDVKLAYIKAERTKRLVTTVSLIAGTVALSIFVILFLTVNVVQKKNLKDLNKDISSTTQKIQSTKDLDKILTVQNQLNSLSGLHDQKVVASRLYDYLGKVTPPTITISSLSVDYALNTMSIAGDSRSLDQVNTYVDTLKFTKFATDKDETVKPAFTNVVLSSFSRTKDGAEYTITLSYDPAIFAATNKVEIKVPTTVTTRSVTEQPLFKTESNGVQ